MTEDNNTQSLVNSLESKLIEISNELRDLESRQYNQYNEGRAEELKNFSRFIRQLLKNNFNVPAKP